MRKADGGGVNFHTYQIRHSWPHGHGLEHIVGRLVAGGWTATGDDLTVQ